MKLIHKQVDGVRVWFIFLSIVVCLLIIAVLLDAPKIVARFPFGASQGTEGLTKGKIKIDGIVFNVAVADTENERRQGLSGAPYLADRTGMLFVFPDNDQHGIWMKDMKFPIDIIWISENYNIVHVKKDATPESYPTVFKNSKPARYVLELPAGSIETFSFNGLSYLQIDTLFSN